MYMTVLYSAYFSYARHGRVYQDMAMYKAIPEVIMVTWPCINTHRRVQSCPINMINVQRCPLVQNTHMMHLGQH